MIALVRPVLSDGLSEGPKVGDVAVGGSVGRNASGPVRNSGIPLSELGPEQAVSRGSSGGVSPGLRSAADR